MARATLVDFYSCHLLLKTQKTIYRESHFTNFSTDVDLNNEITTSVTNLEKCEIWRVRLFTKEINQVDNKLVADTVLFDPSQ